MEKLQNKNNISQDLKVLGNFLIANKNKNNSGMNTTMFHGFLYAIISSPITIMPNDWLYVLFGGFPEFQSTKDQKEVYEAALTLYGFVKLKLNSHTRTDLLIWQDDGTEVDLMTATDPMLVDFCTGYIKGYLLDPVVKDTFVELPDLSLAFFLAIIKLGTNTTKSTKVSSEKSKIDTSMRIALQNLMVENHINWEKIRDLHFRKTYFHDCFYK